MNGYNDNVPDTSEATNWITTDIFEARGKLWIIDSTGHVVEYIKPRGK